MSYDVYRKYTLGYEVVKLDRNARLPTSATSAVVALTYLFTYQSGWAPFQSSIHSLPFAKFNLPLREAWLLGIVYGNMF